MPYASSHNGAPVISDDNADQFIDPVVAGHRRFCALQPRDYARHPESQGFAAIKPLKVPSPREVIERIKQREANQSGLSHILDANGVPVKDQNGRLLCWNYGTVHAAEISRVVQGEKYLALSATASAAMITGGVDRGGYCLEAIEHLTNVGAPLESEWPEHDLSLRHKTPQIMESCSRNRIKTWGQLPSGDLDQINAALLLNFPVPIELPWWRHVVCLIDLVLLAGDVIGYLFDNSWSRHWGKNGRGILTPEKARGTAFYPMSVLPSF